MKLPFSLGIRARVWGETAVAVVLLGFAFGISWAPISAWVKNIVVLAAVGAGALRVLAAGYRQIFGGSADLEIRTGRSRFTALGVRVHEILEMARYATEWVRPLPLPAPEGIVIGSPADPHSVVAGRQGAQLPDNIEVTVQSQNVPEDAATVSPPPAAPQGQAPDEAHPH